MLRLGHTRALTIPDACAPHEDALGALLGAAALEPAGAAALKRLEVDDFTPSLAALLASPRFPALRTIALMSEYDSQVTPVALLEDARITASHVNVTPAELCHVLDARPTMPPLWKLMTLRLPEGGAASVAPLRRLADAGVRANTLTLDSVDEEEATDEDAAAIGVAVALIAEHSLMFTPNVDLEVAAHVIRACMGRGVVKTYAVVGIANGILLETMVEAGGTMDALSLYFDNDNMYDDELTLTSAALRALLMRDSIRSLTVGMRNELEGATINHLMTVICAPESAGLTSLTVILSAKNAERYVIPRLSALPNLRELGLMLFEVDGDLDSAVRLGAAVATAAPSVRQISLDMPDRAAPEWIRAFMVAFAPAE